MPEPWRFRVTFRPGDLPGVLDMLRYDGATVLDWEQDKDGRFTVTLSARRPEVARWHSFGLYPVNPDSGYQLL